MEKEGLYAFRVRYFVNLVIILIFAVCYAKIESIYHELLGWETPPQHGSEPWGKPLGFVFPMPDFSYHSFVFALIVLLAFQPLMQDILYVVKRRISAFFFSLGNLLTLLWVEDRMYYFWLGRFISPSDWTSSGGYIPLPWGDSFPIWYILLIGISLTCYLFSIKKSRLRSASPHNN